MRYRRIDYDYECGIELFTTCNFRCEYCSGPRVKKELRRGRTPEDADKVIRFFNSSGANWLLGMSGGEPTIHPQFKRLVTGLAEKHFFYFFTNLSCDIRLFTDLVPPSRVQYIKASLHPMGEEKSFFSKFGKLYEKGYNPIVIMVSAPDQFSRIKDVAKLCQREGYPFTLSVMEGPYRGKNYPADYSEEEREIILEYTEEPGNLIRLLAGTSGGMNTFGLDCEAGQRSFYLDMESGDFLTCESVHEHHGNIYDGTFVPREKIFTCPAVSGCVGYDRNILIPQQYREFFSTNREGMVLKPVKESPLFPDNLENVVKSDRESSDQLVQDALAAIFKNISGKKTMFWGGGIYGGKILYYLRKKYGEGALQNVIGFVDSLPDRQKIEVLGLPVYAPEADKVREAEILLITSYVYESDIAVQAAKLGLSGIVIPLHQKILRPMNINASIF